MYYHRSLLLREVRVRISSVWLSRTMATGGEGVTDFVSVLVTIAVAFARVIPPVYPPPSPQVVYDTYIGLTPIVSHFVLFLLLIPLQVLLSVFFPSTLGLNDRVLPLLPVLAAALYTCHGPLSSDRRTDESADARLVLMTFLVCLWAVQSLRVAVSRGDLDRTVDDYRYAKIRSWVGRFFFAQFSLLLTAINTIVAFFLTTPFYFAWNARQAWPGSLGPGEAAIAIVILCAVTCKEIAARQVATCVRENPQMGFMTTGLYAWVRQPEVLADLVIWWAFYGFTVLLGGSMVAWPIVGVIMYSVLHVIWLLATERMTVDEFPNYRTDVQSKVWLLLPTPPSREESSSKQKEKKDN